MKKHIPNLFFFLLILFIGIQSCKKENMQTQIPTPVVTKKYFTWLQPGHRWVYDFVVNGQVADSLVREILSVDSAKTYHAVLKDNDVTLQEYYYRDGEWLMYYTNGQTPAEARALNKATAKKGDNWQRIVQGDTLQTTVEQTDTLLSNAAGTFSCRVLQEKNTRTKEVSVFYVNETYGTIQMQITYSGFKCIYRLRKKNF